MKPLFIKSDTNLRSIISMAAFTGLSVVGGLLKLPSPSGSIALDSAPALFAAGFASPIVGAVVGFSGHIASAATGGFPQGPLHFIIALGMFVTCFIYGFFIRNIDRWWAIVPGSVVAVVLNCLIPFACIPLGLPVSLAITIVFPFLIVAASINAVLASALLLAISKINAPGI